MRPLNRPMFRYGGPIKQGIMSGIREPKRGGGSMGNLVGSPLYPKTGGREHHAAVAAIPWLLRAATIPFGRWATTQAAKKGVTGGGGIIRSGLGRSRVMQPGESLTQSVNKFTPYKFWSQDPLVKAGMTGAGWTGKALKKGAGLAKWGVTTPSGLALTLPGGFFYAKGKWWDKNNNPADPNDIAAAKASTGGPPGGGDPGMQGTGEWFAEQAEKEALAKQQKDWNNRIKRYRDIMDIKGMNKEAAYKSLIDASKLIQESQDFKGDIKSGKLINQVIQAASKQFDKPSKTSDAINTLILQNELKKDLNKETTALDKAYKQSAIALNEAKLAENSLAGDIRAYTAKNQALPAGNTLAGYAKGRGYDIESVASTTEVKNWMTKNGKTEVEFLQEVIQNNPGNVKPGNHVINDKIFNVSEDLQITGQIV